MKYLKWIFANNPDGKKYNINEITVCDTWDPSNPDWDKRGGFNFSTEQSILRWISRGDTLYEVTLPEDAEVLKVENSKTPDGIYVANKIIIKNPIPLSDSLTMELYEKSDIPEQTYFETIGALAISGCYETCLRIIREKVNLDNIDLALEKYLDFIKPWHKGHINEEVYQKVLEVLKEIKNDLSICLTIDKEPYIKAITDDKIINLTGQSGSGKTTYAKEHYMTDEYLLIDTDKIFSEEEYAHSTGINKELGTYFRKKYDVLPSLGEDFDQIYKDIIEYCSQYDKIIVIDTAQIHCIHDLSLLKGKIIILRTAIDHCYERCIERYQKNHPNASVESLEKYKIKKLKIYDWYKYTNEVIRH